MSGVSIELEPVSTPAAVAKPIARRPSTIAPSVAPSIGLPWENEYDHDSYSLHSLERVSTVTTKSKTAAVIASVTLVTAISSLLSGLTTVALPTMAVDLGIEQNILLWPSSIQALTCGCTLLISGSVADAVGARYMYIAGSVLQSGFTLGCGLSRNAAEMILFRGLSGIAISFCLPSAVSIITGTFVGKRRDLAFASMGGGQPVGFSIGLALGGVLTDSIGWRWGFYISAIFNTAVLGIAIWGLPKSIDSSSTTGAPLTWNEKWQRIKTEVDWVGALIASTSLAAMSYVLAAITGTSSDIKQPENIVLLVVAVALIPVFIFWVGRQEKLGRPAIIPNSLWRNKIFTTICLAVFFIWGSFNALETILTFYFQKVQGLSATQTSIRFLPAPVSGVIMNAAIGSLVNRVPGNWLTISGCAISLVAPLAMAFSTPTSSFWASGFLANVFNPVQADSLFTVSNLLITSVFPPKTQGLAGGVFNTVSQIGKSVGLALVAVIAASVTADSNLEDKSSPEALQQGYRATYWFCFAVTLFTIVISTWGLRSIGRVGHKRD